MIRLCIFDMGGVVVRDINCWPEISAFLNISEERIRDPAFSEVQHQYGLGRIDEDEVWRRFTQITARPVPLHQGSILGRFFTPRLDQATVDVITKLKAGGTRVVCGTNTGDAHYTVHQQLNQYGMFDRVYASHLMHLAKPDPAFYTHILEAEQVKPEEAFFTDDWPPNAEAASKLGIVGFTYTGADTLINQLRSLGISIEH
jgi:putative hydrolase of the HAD superfamily